MAPLLISFKHLNWMRFWIIVGTTYVLWLGLATVIPPKIHTPVLAILGAIQSALVFLIRSNKYVETRQEVPRSGEQP